LCADVLLTGFPRILESSGFFPGFSRPWEVLENQFGPGKPWKWKLKVLESTGKWRSWTVDEFTAGSK